MLHKSGGGEDFVPLVGGHGGDGRVDHPHRSDSLPVDLQGGNGPVGLNGVGDGGGGLGGPPEGDDRGGGHVCR